MNTFSIGDALRTGWETFKKRPWFFMLVAFGFGVFGEVASNVMEQMEPGFTLFVFWLSYMAVSTVLSMGLVHIALKALDDPMSVTFSDLWHPHPFWKYVGAYILLVLAVFGGLILLIIPGVMAMIAFLFTQYVVLEKGTLPVATLKESARITKGHRMQLFLFVLALVGINLLGALALLVGLLVSVPISMIAMAYAYRTFSRMAGASEVVAAPAPVAPPAPTPAQ